MRRLPSIFWHPFSFDEEAWEIESTAANGLSIWEDQEYVYVEAALPGLTEDEIEVSFDKGVLWIRAEKKEEQKNDEKKYYHKAERSFYYRVSIPQEIDESKEPQATLEKGVMHVRFHRSKPSQPRKIQIKKS